MPALAGKLSEDEIRAGLSFIKNTWRERQRETQAGISGNGQKASP